VKTQTIAPNEKHLRFRKALENAIAQTGEELEAEELLAITAHFLGQLIACQDQRKFTTKIIMDLVSENIEQGNREAVEKLSNEIGGNA
jgi:hypothetical protein